MLPHQENCRIFGYRPHQYFWFMLSGFLCDCVQAFIDFLISKIYVFEFEKNTICWTLSYTASIFVRHFSHKILVFGAYEGSYWQSLARVYFAYLSSIILSTIANLALSNYFGLSHTQAWFSTMIWVGVYNYYALKNVWASTNNANASAQPSDETSKVSFVSKATTTLTNLYLTIQLRIRMQVENIMNLVSGGRGVYSLVHVEPDVELAAPVVPVVTSPSRGQLSTSEETDAANVIRHVASMSNVSSHDAIVETVDDGEDHHEI